jgi:hypothetical protein
MLWFVRLLAPLFGKIAAAPVLDIIDKLVADADLKEKLKAELKGKLLEREQALIAARQSVVLAELNSESAITRSWRPILMFVLMGFLLFFGLIVPLIELGLGHPVPVEPRLDRIPEPAWNLLTLGLGGYVGGRTVEKVALGWLARSSPLQRPAKQTRKSRTLRR